MSDNLDDGQRNAKLVEMHLKQFESLQQWSRFYHDTETKINAGAALGSGALVFVKLLIGERTCESAPLFGHSMFGALIMIVSIAAIASTVGYWRYYEFCDMLSKRFRRRAYELLDAKNELDEIRKRFGEEFRDEYPILGAKFLVNAHHIVWLSVHMAFFVVGVALLASCGS